MKLKTLIQRLESKRRAYVKAHGAEPHVFDWSDGELLLCWKVSRRRGTTTAEKPYITAKIKRPGDL